MPHKNRIVKPARIKGTVLAEDGRVLQIPTGWELLEPGDGPLTKRVKSKGVSWLVQVKKGRRLMSKGIWTARENIAEGRREVEEKRSTDSYAQKERQILPEKRGYTTNMWQPFPVKLPLFSRLPPSIRTLKSNWLWQLQSMQPL